MLLCRTDQHLQETLPSVTAAKEGHTRYWKQRFTYFCNAQICNTGSFFSINKWQRKYFSLTCSIRFSLSTFRTYMKIGWCFGSYLCRNIENSTSSTVYAIYLDQSLFMTGWIVYKSGLNSLRESIPLLIWCFHLSIFSTPIPRRLNQVSNADDVPSRANWYQLRGHVSEWVSWKSRNQYLFFNRFIGSYICFAWRLFIRISAEYMFTCIKKGSWMTRYT